ncbi:MAG: hypothetical protein QXM31_00065 [Candidatus Woesearchaeota archaeon]
MSYCGSSAGYGSPGCGSYGVQPVYCSMNYSSSRGSYGGMFSWGSPSASYGGSWNAESKLYAHSSIDSMVSHESVARASCAAMHYVPGSAKGAYLAGRAPLDYFVADTFLRPGSTARFVGDAAEIRDDIEAAFRATTGESLPSDIIIHVLNEKEFRKAHREHAGAWNDGIMGFSLNANSRGASEVFARADQLDRLMLTIGHEIGHVLTRTLRSPHDEEAKAFAFSLAWMKAIRENNIAGIGGNILPEPASNGLHDIAFGFVQRVITAGATAMEAFRQLANGTITITQEAELAEV